MEAKILEKLEEILARLDRLERAIPLPHEQDVPDSRLNVASKWIPSNPYLKLELAIVAEVPSRFLAELAARNNSPDEFPDSLDIPAKQPE